MDINIEPLIIKDPRAIINAHLYTLNMKGILN